MKFKFVDASEVIKPKASIYRSSRFKGYLSFNLETANFLDISKGQHFKVAVDIQGPNFTKIYLVKSEALSITAETKRIGSCMGLNLLRPLTFLKIDFENELLKFDFQKEKYDGEEIYVLKLKKS